MRKPLSAVLLLAALTGAGAALSQGHRQSEQNRVREGTQRGEFRPLRDIENRVVPRMGGARYLGPELNGDSYRLKFMQNGNVIWVDVDARTGEVIGRTGD